MILFYDTETTGLPDRFAPLNSERQPHCVQLAAILTDNAGNEQSCINLVVHPDGWAIPASAAEKKPETGSEKESMGMTDPRIEAALMAYSRQPIEEPIKSVMAKALAAADAAARVRVVPFPIPDDRMETAKNTLLCWKGGALSDEDAIGMIVCGTAAPPGDEVKA